jgi:pimeloyl-ACP methyl ester carboxylesterase
MQIKNVPVPKLRHTLSDFPRAGLEIQSLLLAMPLLQNAAHGDNHAVLVIPGLGGGVGSTSLLRRWLSRHHFNSQHWSVGRNLPEHRMGNLDEALRFRQEMVHILSQRVQELHHLHGRKISLVGWSLGGLYAMDVARQHPELIRQVITLGTPHGDPRGTAVWGMFEKLNHDKQIPQESNIKAWLGNNLGAPCPVPTTVIYSPCDGFVSTATAKLPSSTGAAHLTVRSSHAGLTINPRVYWLIANRLAQPETQEKALHKAGIPWLVKL